MHPLRATRRPVSLEVAQVVIRAICDVIVTTVRPEAVYLFGSAARGELSSHSDLDFLIVCRDTMAMNAARRGMRRTLPRTEFPIDLVWMTSDEFWTRKTVGGVAYEAAEAGVQLYNGVDK